MTEFDPIKALNEEITALVDVQKSMAARNRVAEEAMAKAETELNDLRKVKAIVDIEIDRKRSVLRELQDEKAKREKST
jgi:hypothetical protein